MGLGSNVKVEVKVRWSWVNSVERRRWRNTIGRNNYYHNKIVGDGYKYIMKTINYRIKLQVKPFLNVAILPPTLSWGSIPHD